MSIIKREDGKKWTNAFVALVAIVFGYLVIKFTQQLGQWFDLEARVQHFLGVSQGIGIVGGLALFLYVLKNNNSATYLTEVYGELVKVVWPDKDSVLKATVGIIIGLSIVSGIFVAIDFLSRSFLELLY